MSYTPTEWEPTDAVTATRINALETAVGDMNMSYTPNVWSDGDILSAEKMNALEQAVASGGGGSWTVLTEESVTVGGAGGSLTYNTQITADTIKVTFNGTEYTVSPSIDTSPFGTSYTYGAQFSEELDRYDYSTYPFSVVSTSNGANTLHTETAGTYSVKIEAPQSGGSSDFSTAQVTIINNAQSDFVLYFPNIFDNRVLGYRDSSDIDGSPVEAVLYKGVCHITYTSDDTLNISVTGNATISRKKVVIVTGDCTITIS